MQDLLGGQVDAMFPSLTTAVPHIKSGKLRALVVAVRASKRDLAPPETKTRLHDMAAEPSPLTPAQFESFLKAEVAKWAQLVRDTNLQIEQ